MLEQALRVQTMLSTVQLKLMKQRKKRLISQSLVDMQPRSQSRMLQLDRILRTSNGLNLRIWLNSSRICLLKHQVPPISFSIILNSPQTSQLDQDLTLYEKITEKRYCRHDQNGSYQRVQFSVCVACCSSRNKTTQTACALIIGD